VQELTLVVLFFHWLEAKVWPLDMGTACQEVASHPYPKFRYSYRVSNHQSAATVPKKPLKGQPITARSNIIQDLSMFPERAALLQVFLMSITEKPHLHRPR
jgi:hypothetical protein